MRILGCSRASFPIKNKAMSIPVMMTIAGSDCSAGAGLQADLKAAHAMGAFALTAVTCVVSEAPGTVRGIQEVDPALVADQVRINLEHFPVRAVKTGMLYSPAIVRAVHGVLDGADIPVVVDPVMIATAGDRLMREEAVAVYEELLLPGAALLTPNLDEAAVLLRSSVNPGRDELPEAAARLAVRYGCPVLLKGGHLEGDCRDVLSGPDGCLLGQWERPRVQDVSTHGTGCSLSAAVAARLAAGDGLVAAVERGLEFIASAIRNHLRWEQPVRVDALKLW
ncbi:bifunctional hydroxymethylpyrimidine kinase/phosphomethylpyrimidine kinase [Akkermansia muciniphila]|nr:bifunctional hydroxymethylpyrimidine kinase/phosphomethylpyrimidine kinase [Akkermansia muciniphila]QHV64651.1 bifunctional hydroxymethylpyrimidine kinase/phosphomethylpyrimidine kinase [Akkermansia muciniphila]QHV67099.1 bifunctional hydroxymethylpyrimidine kinase/phosphomethylpyrimidine kinase [Akkermansia muciniphila]QHV69567.1 bifunctional hydroxymethylpyrimidine kinase/phosphomethylpyrimidine kinase [Akkermansia muciniphila]QHV72021.1 bifunctional hydroxymethylpyrimidine kinase/phosphom